MSFIKNMIEHDLSLLQTLDGQYIIYTSKQGNPRIIDGMLQEHTQMIPGGHIEVVATHPVLSVRSIDLPEVQTDDQISVDNDNYRVAVIRPSNESIIELILERL